MNQLLRLSAGERKILFEEVASRMGFAPPSIEKDLWVCWALKTLFALPGLGSHLCFKGGTSLSKCWGYIDRFSEDIDLVIPRAYLGCTGAKSPEHQPSRTQQEARLDELMTACRRLIAERIVPLVNEHMNAVLRGGVGWKVEVDPDEFQTILLHYPSAFSKRDRYMRSIVKIELGARSDTDPVETRDVMPFVGAGAFPVRVVAARRTFWEKILLLHEETQRPKMHPSRPRLARHYYDIWSLIQKGVSVDAEREMHLLRSIADHSAVYFRQTGVNYSTARPGTLRILPAASDVAAWRRDYEAMRESMFPSDPPSFDEILRVVGAFEARVNRSV